MFFSKFNEWLESNRNCFAIAADALTLFRGIGIPLIFFGLWTAGIRSWTLAADFMLGGWMTDMLDGKFARLGGQPSWIGGKGGENEVVFDLLFVVGGELYVLVSFPLWTAVKTAIGIWALASLASVYGQVRHRSFSFVAITESTAAVPLTLGLLASSLIYELNWLTIFLTGCFTGMGLLNIPRGLQAMAELNFKVRHLKEDMRKAFSGLNKPAR